MASTATETLPRPGPLLQPGLPPAAAFHCCLLSFDRSPSLCNKGKVPGYPATGASEPNLGALCPAEGLSASGRAVTRTFWRSMLRGAVAASIHNTLLPEARERWWGWEAPRWGQAWWATPRDLGTHAAHSHKPGPGLGRPHHTSRDFYCGTKISSDIPFSPFINIASSQCNYRRRSGMSTY